MGFESFSSFLQPPFLRHSLYGFHQSLVPRRGATSRSECVRTRHQIVDTSFYSCSPRYDAFSRKRLVFIPPVLGEPPGTLAFDCLGRSQPKAEIPREWKDGKDVGSAIKRFAGRAHGVSTIILQTPIDCHSCCFSLSLSPPPSLSPSVPQEYWFAFYGDTSSPETLEQACNSQEEASLVHPSEATWGCKYPAEAAFRERRKPCRLVTFNISETSKQHKTIGTYPRSSICYDRQGTRPTGPRFRLFERVKRGRNVLWSISS